MNHHSLHIGNTLKICHFNIESISNAKSTVLSKLMLEQSVDIIALQETHTKDTTDLTKRGQISGYSLVGAIHDPRYGIATYIKEGLSGYKITSESNVGDIFLLAIEINGITIVNVYKPPGTIWPNPPLHVFNHPVIYVGDLNSHHQMWGYDTNDFNGNLLMDWISINLLNIVYSAKHLGTFRSARWQKDYSPDMCITSRSTLSNNTHREVISCFPHSQHRPVLITYGCQIPLINSIPKPRWNFQLANWDLFADTLDRTVQWIPPEINNYERFVNAIKVTAKKSLPRGYRKIYIPGWSDQCELLYQDFMSNGGEEKATELIEALDETRREKWHSLTASLNFTHSSRQAWGLLKKLGSDTQQNKVIKKISSNQIASRLLQMSKVKIDKNHKKQMKKEVRRKKSRLFPHPEYSRGFSMKELTEAIDVIKVNKAAGFDGVRPEFIKNFGIVTKTWLLNFFNNILMYGRLPRSFKITKVVAILKPGKDGSDPSHYRPISLLSVVYKLLERMVLNRIEEAIDNVTPVEQGGFRHGRSCCDQVLALTTCIEAGYQRMEKTAVAFVDLTAAYDTVWRHGLLTKLINVIPCKKIITLIESMLTNRRFRVVMDDDVSRWRTLNDGLAQGSVLSPKLFNLYISDMPETYSKKIQFADDLALVCQSRRIYDCETTLTRDLSNLNEYFKNWRLKPNPRKTEVSLFHLNNRESNLRLNVNFSGEILEFNEYPKYLGVILDRTLTFKKHLEMLSKKVRTRLNLMYKICGTSWGASAETLRTTALSLVYSTAEYCAPVWAHSVHTSKIDVHLNQAMRIISGTVRSTPLPWLPVLSNITPPSIRREAACIKEFKKCIQNGNSLLYRELQGLPNIRLTSRNPAWTSVDFINRFNIKEKWKNSWSNNLPTNNFLINDPTKRVEGFNFPRKEWTALNRFRTGQGRCASILHRWNYIEDPGCDCGAQEQSMLHILECPLRGFAGGLNALHKATPEGFKLHYHTRVVLTT